MTTDFRALCAKLHAAFNTYAVDQSHHELLQRARAALAQSEPEGPTRRQLMMLADDMGMTTVGAVTPAEYARAVLARWGRPAPQPVPVSERLPGPDDCDAEGKVWGTAELGGWTRVHHSKISRWRAWLPAHALLLPGEAES